MFSSRPIVLASIWDLLTCAYHQYVSAARLPMSVGSVPLRQVPPPPPPRYWETNAEESRVGLSVYRSNSLSWAGSACTKRVGFFAKFLGVALPFIHPSVVCLPACLLLACPPHQHHPLFLPIQSPYSLFAFYLHGRSPFLLPSHASPLSSLLIASPTTGGQTGRPNYKF